MAGEGQLAPRRENAQARRIDRVVRLEDEHRLGEIELASDRLHALVVKALAIEHDGQRIAGERRLGKDIERIVFAAHRSYVLKSVPAQSGARGRRALAARR